MKTIEEARKRWDTLFRGNDTPSELRTALKSEQGGTLCRDGLRSVYWKAFLLFDNLDRTQWPQKISEPRSAYSALRSHFLKYIENPDDLQSSVDPLADDEESPWQTLRYDEKLRAEIAQDVDRCLQENFFFREPVTKARMVDILFIYCKLNPDLGYRQGMHELLAPILWVVDRDALDTRSVDQAGSPEKNDGLMLQLLDSSYVEHDSFSLFCCVMQTARVYYEHTEQQSASGRVDTIPIVSRCEHVHNDLLMAVDPELAQHMQVLEILPQIFLTRWMRLLFGREFPFEDTLMVWDLLFAEGLESDLVEFTCIAMLLRIRWQLLNADHSSVLTMLLRYPSPHPHGPQSFVHDAISLRQSLTSETGGSIISKYSGKAPAFSKLLRKPSLRPTHTRDTLWSDFKGSSEDSSPARSPARTNTRSLEGLFQDVTEGIQRRTETWGVAKAVRGAVSDARRNMHTMQWEARPRATRSEGAPSSAPRDGLLTQESNTADLKSKIDALEERNKVLAKMLSQALGDMRSHMAKDEGLDPSTSGAMKQALTRVESVQICLENASIPLDSTDVPSTVADDRNRARLTDKRTTGEVARKEPAEQKKPSPVTTDVPARPSTKSEPPDQTSTSSDRESTTSMPLRTTVRPSLAESEFSWMLGGDRNPSGFASSASEPPEQARNGSKARSNTLFGNGKDEEQRRGSVDSDVAMNSLRGRSKLLDK